MKIRLYITYFKGTNNQVFNDVLEFYVQEYRWSFWKFKRVWKNKIHTGGLITRINDDHDLMMALITINDERLKYPNAKIVNKTHWKI